MKAIVFFASFILPWLLPGQEIAQWHLNLYGGVGVSSFHAQKVTYPFMIKPIYYFGLNIEGEKRLSGQFSLSLEIKGAKNSFNNWALNFTYLTASIGGRLNSKNDFDIGSGGFVSYIISKSITSNDSRQSSNVDAYWNKYDAGLWIECSKLMNWTAEIEHNKVRLGFFFRGQYGLINTLEKWSGLLSSQGDWIRNAFVVLGVKIRLE